MYWHQHNRKTKALPIELRQKILPNDPKTDHVVETGTNRSRHYFGELWVKALDGLNVQKYINTYITTEYNNKPESKITQIFGSSTEMC